MNIEDCFKKELLIRKKPAREEAESSIEVAGETLISVKKLLSL